MHPSARNPASSFSIFSKSLRLIGGASLCLCSLAYSAGFTTRNSQNSLQWNFDDASLSDLYFPQQGMGMVVAIPANPVDPSGENWSDLAQESALFSGKTPDISQYSSVRWSIALPLGPIATLRARSGSATRLRYEESTQATHVLHDSTANASIQLDGTQNSSALLELGYISHEISLILHKPAWKLELKVLRHQFDLQAAAQLDGTYAGSLRNDSGTVTIAYGPGQKSYNGDWQAHYSGSAWSAGLRAGLSWLEIGLDFSTRFALAGQSHGEWHLPDLLDPMTAMPRLDSTSWRSQEEQERLRTAPLQEHVVQLSDSLWITIPKRLSVALIPSPHLRCEYTYQDGSFQIQKSTPASTNPWDWSRYLAGQFETTHQLLLKSPWRYGYLYGGGLWLNGRAPWSPLSGLLPQNSLLPELGAGLTLGNTYKLVIGTEILPAVRINLGASYAL
jgi:hypothetical protein